MISGRQDWPIDAMEDVMISRILKLAIVAGAIAFTGLNGQPAQAEYPERPITVIVPTKAGGGVDTQARALVTAMEAELGQPINIVNKPGAGGTVGLQQLAAMRPDGYNIAMAASVSFLQNPITQGLDMGVDSFTVLGTTGAFQTALVASGSAPFKSWDEFIAFAKENPGTKWYSLGKATVVVMQAIAKAEGIEMAIVPGQGGATVAPTLIAGDADVSFSGGVHSKFLPSKELQVLLSTLSTGKLKATPDVPNSQERYGVSLANNMTVLAPAGLPPEIAAKLEAAVEKAANSDGYAEVMNKIQYPVTYSNSADSTAQYLQDEAGFKALLSN